MWHFPSLTLESFFLLILLNFLLEHFPGVLPNFIWPITRVISLSLCSFHPLECQILFLTKSQSFHLSNNDSGARCWGNLLSQRGRGSSKLTFLLRWHPTQRLPFLFCHLKQKPQIECPSFLLPVHLSICPPDSLFLSMVFSCSLPVNWLLVPILTYAWLYLILFTINRKLLD